MFMSASFSFFFIKAKAGALRQKGGESKLIVNFAGFSNVLN